MINILTLITLVAISLILTYFLRKIAIKRSLLDIPNERSSHTKPTPRTGGIAIALCWYFYLIIILFFLKQLETWTIAFLFCLPLSIVSLIDDLIKVKPLIRFIIQLSCIACAWFYLTVNYEVSYPLVSFIFLSIILILSGVWFVNLYNFLDGIDGFAGTQAIVYFLVSFFITQEFFLLHVSMIVLGFIVWNWPPAKVFMGDTGSTLLGFIIFICSIYFHISGKQNLLISLAFSSIFWFDASLTLFRRALNKDKLTKPHKKHAYQRLVQSGFSHKKVTLVLFLLYAIIFLSYFIFRNFIFNNYFVIAVAIILNIAYYVFTEKRKAFDKN